jgi:hypothetical protein
MNITLRKNPQLNLEDAAQKRAQARHAQSIPLPESDVADFTAASARALKRLQVEQGLLRPTLDTGNIVIGALIENERNTISLRSED